MSKLTDIKFRIDQLDGGTFQNLCDAYLACSGYGTGYSLGMKTGTNKTAKGNPDTYFLTKDEKYVFVMYTTQKDDFLKKVLEDLEKCFDSSKTGLPPEDISEIVYCHTSGRLLPGDHQKLQNFCAEQKTKLTLIGLDELGNGLYLKCPRLAKDFLGVCVDTGQITSISEFVKINDANKMSAPLDTEFLLREAELKAAKEKLSLSDVLILTGPAGVGKTRLALQLCEDSARENGYEVICVKSNGLELYEDLVTAIEAGKDYLVFVDDANELTGLHFVLDYLPRMVVGQSGVKKVVMTVRDYARQQVVNQVLEVERPETLRVGLLKDEDIRKLMENAFGITNFVYLDRIVSIAEGNARLAMLAGKVAAETEQINSIQDATQLYDHYYGKQIEVIACSKTGVKSAGIMAFLQALRLDCLERLHPIFAAMDLTEDQFISDLKQLHITELVDLRHDKAAKISDQSFSNYLIKYAFVDKRIIPLSQMVESCFFINKEKTISACNILLRVFSDQHVQEYVEQQINIVWDQLKCDKERFFPFFKSFYMIRPTETLAFLKEAIDQEAFQPFDIRSIPFKKSGNEKSINDDFIGILCGFALHSQLPEAIELLLSYYGKRPDLFEQIFSAFVIEFGVDKDSPRYGYFTQKNVVERLCRAVEENSNDEVMLLFVRVAEQYLKLRFSRVEEGRQNTFTSYIMPLTLHEVVLDYRKSLLEQIYKIYENGKCREEIESLLMDYCQECGESIDFEIVKKDLENIIKFFAMFSPDNLYHCVLVDHINNVARCAGYDCGVVVGPFLKSHKFKIYNMLKSDHREMVQMGHREYENWHKEQIQKAVREYSLSEFRYLLAVCKETLETIDQDARHLRWGVECVIEAFSSKHELYVEAIKAYMDADTPYDICVDGVLCILLKIMSPEDVKELIDAHDFFQKNTWLWNFYVELPEDEINAAWADDLLHFFEKVPENLHSSPYRSIEKLEKFICADKDILLKASKVILSHHDESPFVFSLYFSPMINAHYANAGEIIVKYKNDIRLLQDIYLKCVGYSRYEDYDGQFLAELIKEDLEFLNCYLEIILELALNPYGSRDEWVDRLRFIWTNDEYMFYMTRISDYIFEKTEGNSWTYRSVISLLLCHKSGEDAIAERQVEWIRHTIKTHYCDKQRMYGLFSAIEEQSTNRRRGALEVLLSLNKDYSLFEELPLEASHWGGWGSIIPSMRNRIEYLASLLPLLSGIEFLKHKQRIEREIKMWEARIKSEEIQELLSSLG